MVSVGTICTTIARASTEMIRSTITRTMDQYLGVPLGRSGGVGLRGGAAANERGGRGVVQTLRRSVMLS
jgi:hypothetical protein